VVAAAAAAVAAIVAIDGERRVPNPSVNKRLKERQRQDRQREKAERKRQRRDEKATRPDVAPGEDPDIAGIVPGPQPPPGDA
jgi:hypothetical protein